MMNNVQKIKILSLLVVLSVTVITSLILTQQSQELRKSAVGQVKQYFEPSSVTNLKIGETRQVKIMVDTAGEIIDTATIIICYPKEYGESAVSTVKWGSSFDTGQSMVVKLNQSNSNLLCSRLETIIGFSGKEQKPSGLVEVATMTITGVKEGTMDTIKDQINDPVRDRLFQSMLGGNFTSGETRVFDSVGSLKISMATDVITNTPTPTPTNTPTPVLTNTPTPTPTPSKDDYVLKFEVVFPGVRPNYTCAEDFKKVNVIVESSVGTTFTAKDLILTKTTATADIGETLPVAVYRGQVSLTGFNYNNNLAVIIKGAKHLGVRYVDNNQNGCRVSRVGKLGGLTKDASKTPIFDFKKMPLLSGDVNGNDLLNAEDYTLMKAHVNTTNDKVYDLNGDCVVNAVDPTYMLTSLRERCGDTY